MSMTAAAILGGGALLSGGIGAITGNRRAREDREWNAEQAQISRDWQEEMSNTAHQRQVADMKEAGLNPALSGKLGGAAAGRGAVAGGSNTAAAALQTQQMIGQMLMAGATSAMKADQLGLHRDTNRIMNQTNSVAAKALREGKQYARIKGNVHRMQMGGAFQK